ncbi:type VI secretion system Vgr family protein [Roseiconus lacunae]|uniref:type VI secretion system Vgr family protein n=1 Tax=Roseiconus lacunae TaxID=2605694 RepID=UPI00135B35B5|nr:type VI secretion system tip protein VgrG [Roseiconus lacunae]MCD0463681.1 type VI secretion system tip protein VgrG [Roseiconus lacunae]
MNALQKNRGLQITTTAGDDTLLLSRMVAREHLGRPFEINVELLSKNHNVDLESLLGSVTTIEYTLPSGKSRYFNGRFSQISWAGSKEHFARYEATIVPWFWFLTRTADCRIFQGKTVPEIIKEIFRDHGFTDFADHLSGEYPKSDYCVQYRESDFDFVSRLMEQEGIYYFFTHEKNKHQLHFADSVSAHSSRTDYGTLRFYPPDPRRLQEFEHIHQWGVSLEVQSGSYVLNDFDFERPTADLLAKSKLERQHDLSKFEVFDYPGDYRVSATGTKYSQRRIEEQQAKFERVRGTTNAFGLECGALFKLENHQRSDQNCEHLVVSTRIELHNSEFETVDGGSPMEFNCDFTAMKSSTVFRSPRTTPLPRIRGPQTAIVVGKKKEEIWTDKYGRVKVHFHWDRKDKRDENSSCWVRVAQSWAGKGWGSIHIPRIGQEVIVEFLEGDPNCPIITGRVYNADEMPPYKLPENRTQSGIKTRSTTQGNNQNFNELRFDDEVNSEQIYFHAEKNFERVVENNDSLKVGFSDNDKKDFEGNQDIEIFNNQTIVVGNKDAKDGSQSITIHKDYSQTIKEGDATITIDKGDRTSTVKQGDDTLDIKQGAQTTKAAKSILLKVGNNSIKIDQQQIAIKATKISLQADTQIIIKGAMVTAEAQGVMTVKGGVVKLN